MAARRASTPDPATASAIEQLIQSRTAGLYALARKVRELSTARDAVAAAQKAEQALLMEAQNLQEELVASGWTVDELRQAGLYVGAATVVRRRRRSLTVTPPAAVDVASMQVEPSPDEESPASGTEDGATVSPAEVPVPVG